MFQCCSSDLSLRPHGTQSSQLLPLPCWDVTPAIISWGFRQSRWLFILQRWDCQPHKLLQDWTEGASGPSSPCWCFSYGLTQSGRENKEEQCAAITFTHKEPRGDSKYWVTSWGALKRSGTTNREIHQVNKWAAGRLERGSTTSVSRNGAVLPRHRVVPNRSIAINNNNNKKHLKVAFRFWLCYGINFLRHPVVDCKSVEASSCYWMQCTEGIR